MKISPVNIYNNYKNKTTVKTAFSGVKAQKAPMTFDYFINSLKSQGAKIIYIPSQKEISKQEAQKLFDEIIKNANERFEKEKRRTVLIFKDSGLISDDSILKKIKSAENQAQILVMFQ